MSRTPPTQASLFRNEALARRSVDWIGGVDLRPPAIGWLLCAIGFLALLVLAVLLATGSHTRYASARGALTPRGGVLPVAAPNAGVVVRVLVSEGSAVRAGDVLAEISGELDSVAIGHTRAAITEQLRRQRDTLHADLYALDRQTAVRRAGLTTRLRLAHAQVERVDARIALQAQRVAGVCAALPRWRSALAKGLVSELQVLEQQDRGIDAQAALEDLRRERIALLAEAAALQAELDLLPAARAQDGNAIERQLAGLSNSVSENEAQRLTQLRAVVSGRVVNLRADPGQPFEAQQPLMSLLPADGMLDAEVQVPGAAVAYLEVGDRVSLRYDAFPHRHFGSRRGVIREISANATSADPSGKPGEARYRVRVALAAQTIAVDGKALPLMAGMTLEADFALERRRFMDLVLGPLRALARDGERLAGAQADDDL